MAADPDRLPPKWHTRAGNTGRLTPAALAAPSASQVVEYEPEDSETLVGSTAGLRSAAENFRHAEEHPADEISRLCAHFYGLGWVTGTGGGMSVRRGPLIWFAPTGVQKERLRPEDMFVLEWATGRYLRQPRAPLRPSQCTPLFLAAFDRGAGACIHTHSQWAVLVTLLVEAKKHAKQRGHAVFEIERIEQIKGIPGPPAATTGPSTCGPLSETSPPPAPRHPPAMLGFFDRLTVPIIENTAREEDLTGSLEAAMDAFPSACAVLVRRHGVYVWGADTAAAKTQAESLDYIFQLAVRMHELGLAWTEEGEGEGK